MAKKKTFHRHLLHFMILLVALLLSMVAIVIYSFDRQVQYYLIAAMGLVYVLWGAFHHYVEEDLHPKILMEYILMAMLGMAILFSIISRT